MHIAFTIAPGRGDTDLLLFGLADDLATKGYKTCGTVQINTHCGDDRPCDMDVRVLPEGPEIRISQSLGPEARGCRLDPGALETAIGHCEARLDTADLLIVNKFGKQEVGGRGFRGLIGDALARDLPVLVGLNNANKEAFLEFTDHMAVELAPDPAALRDWLTSALQSDTDAA